jgi:hypothetical protein
MKHDHGRVPLKDEHVAATRCLRLNEFVSSIHSHYA